VTSAPSTVLVTGGAGYVGSVVVRDLLANGYRVRVADALLSGGESLIELFGNPSFEFFRADIRDREAMKAAIQGSQAVVHLAAIVGDPACRQQPELATSTNRDASIALYDLAEEAGCERFIFASTCSNYGRMADPSVMMDESSALAPISLYAETKVAVEQFLLSRPSTNRCKATCLRLSTAHGLSPRMRFDLTVNEFTREVVLDRDLLVFGKQFWRPYAHVDDIARAVRAVLQAAPGLVAFEVFNLGDTRENYTKQMLIDELLTLMPSARIGYKEVNEDPRDYRVNADKIKTRLGFAITKTVPESMREIARALKAGVIPNPDDPKYSNV
jgi:nucleoside-diphosphate-sugar epimerase